MSSPGAGGGRHPGGRDHLRDYVEWHRQYDDPSSSLSWRLATVRAAIRSDLARRAGPVRVASACSGDGRDVLGVLAEPGAPTTVAVTLLEVHPDLAARAREAAAALPHRVTVDVRELDAGVTDSWVGAAPADVVLLVGVLGNLSDDDLTTVAAVLPQLCTAGATVVWTHGGGVEGRSALVRKAFREVGCAETSYDVLPRGSRPTVGVARFEGDPQPLEVGRRFFTMLR